MFDDLQGCVRGQHLLLTGQPIPTQQGWVFLPIGESLVLPKNTVGCVVARHRGAILLKAEDSVTLEGPLNWIELPSEDWDTAVARKKSEAARIYKPFSAIFAASIVALIALCLAQPPGFTPLLMIVTSAVVCSGAVFFAYRDTARVGRSTRGFFYLPRRKRPTPVDRSQGEMAGYMSAIYVVAANGRIDTAS